MKTSPSIGDEIIVGGKSYGKVASVDHDTHTITLALPKDPLRSLYRVAIGMAIFGAAFAAFAVLSALL